MKNLSLRLLILASVTGLAACQQGSNTTADASASNRFMASMSLTVADPMGPPPVDPNNPDAIPCYFNGTWINDATSVTAYQNSTVLEGQQCVSETRTCVNGVLDGTFQYANCAVAAPADCLFDGKTVKHGDAVTAYTSSSVAYGSVCSSVAETRTCNNGVLSGNAQYANCAVAAPRSCLFNGQTMDSGSEVIAYQASTVSYGNTCTKETRTCNDGTLSGSYQYGSCAVDQPASCLFNGQTVANGQTVVAFQTTSVSYGGTCAQETRTCNNGVLSGNYEYSSCVAGQPASCTFNNQTVAHGASVVGYASDSVAYGETCQSEARTCNNGVLSGSMNYSACVVKDPMHCTFNGQSVLHGSTVTAFISATAAYGKTCQSEIRTCTNGVLSGSAQYTSCAVDNPPPAKDCTFNGAAVTSGSSVIAYQNSSVVYGSKCISETRTCSDGVLSGSYTNASCSVQDPKSCTLNGKTISHGASITVFISSTVPYGSTCQSETRNCDNGVLSGSATAESCVVQNSPPSGGGEQCQAKFIWEFPDVCRGNCGKGVGYFKSRISRDGGKTWMVLFKNRMPQDIEQVWNYMISKNGKNSCERPKVTYTPSVNRGYVVMNINQMPDCNVCKFVEVVEGRDDDYNDNRRFNLACHKKPKKVIKFLCGDAKTKSGHDNDHDNNRDDDDHDHENNGKNGNQGNQKNKK